MRKGEGERGNQNLLEWKMRRLEAKTLDFCDQFFHSLDGRAWEWKEQQIGIISGETDDEQNIPELSHLHSLSPFRNAHIS